MLGAGHGLMGGVSARKEMTPDMRDYFLGLKNAIEAKYGQPLNTYEPV